MLKFVGAIAGLALVALASSAQAATVIDAKTIKLTTAGGVVLQVGELVALDFLGTDVALASEGAVATANQVYSDAYGGQNTGPQNAIDGVMPFYRSYYDNPTFFHALNPAGFLNVTLAAPKNLASLSIYGRTDCCSERDIYNVEIFNSSNVSIFSGRLDARNSDHVATVTFDKPAGGVPEPASWALMIMGFGASGALLRRRRLLAA